MGKGSKTRKFAEMKRMIKARDGRLGVNAKKKKKVEVSKRKLKDGKLIERQLPQSSSAMFFQYNERVTKPCMKLMSKQHFSAPENKPRFDHHIKRARSLWTQG